jgi:hypothetical protein
MTRPAERINALIQSRLTEAKLVYECTSPASQVMLYRHVVRSQGEGTALKIRDWSSRRNWHLICSNV